MKNSFRILALVLLLCTLLASFAACDFGKETTTNPSTSSTNPTESSTTKPTEPPKPEWVDYASQVKLDENSDRLRIEVTVHQFVDGDTTHFNVPKTISDSGVLKARYLAINTPESTGAIEEWGKAASKFTRSKLEEATSIILESEDGNWNLDSTGYRHLVWVWYKTADMSDYRNLNLEILQAGLAIASNSANNIYGTYCMAAIDQAREWGLYVYSKDKDPEYFYGEAIQVTLTEIALNPEKYEGMNVAFEGVVAKDDGSSIYVEEYDEVTGMLHGITCFKGYTLSEAGKEIIQVGNRVKIVGSVQYYEAGDIYQISDLSYNPRRPQHPDNIQLIEPGHPASYTLTTPETFCTYKQTVTLIDAEGNEYDKEFAYGELALNTTIEMRDLYVESVYTTNNGGNSDGAMTLTCTVDGYTITVRTTVLLVDGYPVTEEYFLGKTIDVKGLVASFNGNYQIKLISLDDVVVH